MSSKGSTEQVGSATQRISRRTVLLGVGAVAGVGTGGWAIWNYLHEHHAVSVYRSYDQPIYALAWSPDSYRLAAGGVDQAGTALWDALTGEHPLTLGDAQHASDASHLAWSPDGTRLATAGSGNAFVWDARNGQVLAVYQEPAMDATQRAVAWSPDGTRLVSGGEGYATNPTAQIWDATSGKTLLTFRDPTPDTAPGYVYAVAWSPDGRWIATTGFSFAPESSHNLVATLQVWDATTSELLFTHHGNSGDNAILSVAWSPESKRVATGDTNSQAQIWDIPSGRLLLTYHGQRGYINAVGWSPDGRWVASAADDTTAQVWDAQTGQTAYTYRGHSALLRALAWSPDGTYVATGGDDKTVQIWYPR